MASMRDIKRRKSSVQSTQQITKAMKLVSTVKLQRARVAAEKNKCYFDSVFTAIASILSRTGTIDHPFLRKSDTKKNAVIAITSNRGLAGGYNSNIVKMIVNDDRFTKEDTLVYAIGKKGRDALSRKGYTIEGNYDEILNAPLYSDAMEISGILLDKFANGEIGEIYVAYTDFRNTVSQVPEILRLLPLQIEGNEERLEEAAASNVQMNFEPNEDEALDLIVPKAITSLIYGALLESVASENGARMQAMDSATSNAEDLIKSLELSYNRARQGHITQELTEIIGGAEALS